jgi:hypothetical protein
MQEWSSCQSSEQVGRLFFETTSNFFSWLIGFVEILFLLDDHDENGIIQRLINQTMHYGKMICSLIFPIAPALNAARPSASGVFCCNRVFGCVGIAYPEKRNNLPNTHPLFLPIDQIALFLVKGDAQQDDRFAQVVIG